MDLSGFGNYHQSEAIPGALPIHQNSPQICNLGLYAEQLSGSAFTCPRNMNLHSWLYRERPSVVNQDFVSYSKKILHAIAIQQPPNPLRWSAPSIPETPCDFIDGLIHLASNKKNNTYIYCCNESMHKRYFNNYDGELLFVPYSGKIILATEFGDLDIRPGKIAVIPRGISFKVLLTEENACGYICENMGAPLTLPELGPIGSNGLANPRHFIYPQAKVEKIQEEVSFICKSHQEFWISRNSHSPLNVAAWHGNYAPYSYDLSLFNTINTVSFDHPDPSIFTVLTSPSNTPFVPNLDFVIFPSRWMVAENTFRPPYFHRNIMSEFMGLIYGEYDAKSDGFEPGGVSIHNCMVPHGPDASTYALATKQELKPEKLANTLAFMFESNQPWLVSDVAYNDPGRQKEYSRCWKDL